MSIVIQESPLAVYQGISQCECSLTPGGEVPALHPVCLSHSSLWGLTLLSLPPPSALFLSLPTPGNGSPSLQDGLFSPVQQSQLTAQNPGVQSHMYKGSAHTGDPSSTGRKLGHQLAALPAQQSNWGPGPDCQEAHKANLVQAEQVSVFTWAPGRHHLMRSLAPDWTAHVWLSYPGSGSYHLTVVQPLGQGLWGVLGEWEKLWFGAEVLVILSPGAWGPNRTRLLQLLWDGCVPQQSERWATSSFSAQYAPSLWGTRARELVFTAPGAPPPLRSGLRTQPSCHHPHPGDSSPLPRSSFRGFQPITCTRVWEAVPAVKYWRQGPRVYRGWEGCWCPFSFSLLSQRGVTSTSAAAATTKTWGVPWRLSG